VTPVPITPPEWFGRPRLVASDLDGTLVPPTLEVGEGIRAGIAALQTAEIPFVIVTGRMFRSARPMAARLGVVEGPIVCYQGAMLVDLATGERLYHLPMSPEVAADVIVHARELRRHVNAYIDDELIVEEYDAWAQRYAEYAEVGVTTVPDLAAAVRERAPTKIVLTSDAADVAQLLPVLQDRWRGVAYVTRSQPEYLEFCDVAVSKSAALAGLGDRLGIPRAQTVACGDALNDLDMVRWAGLGVVVAEAEADVRAAADLVVERARLGELFVAFARTRRVE
jgi:Cof subfamily protein (haloacid dehalogenase superfamily)